MAAPRITFHYPFYLSSTTRKITHIQPTFRFPSNYSEPFHTTGVIMEEGDSGSIRITCTPGVGGNWAFKLIVVSIDEHLAKNFEVGKKKCFLEIPSTPFVTPPLHLWHHNPAFGGEFICVQLQIYSTTETGRRPPYTPYRQMLVEALKDAPECEMNTSSDDFRQNNHGDITLNLSDGSLKAHKFVLTSRFEYFQRMFESGMKEAFEKVVEMADIEVGIMHIILMYAYEGGAAVLSLLDTAEVRTMFYVFGAADKYGIDKLKNLVALALVGRGKRERGCRSLIHQYLCGKQLTTLAAMVHSNSV